MLALMLQLILSGLVHADANSFQLSVDEYLNPETPVIVPKGNRNNAQESYKESKFTGVLKLISKKENICVIKEAAELYQLDPVTIMGSIIGEHTYNVGAWDIAQENYLYMVKRWISRFEGNGLDLGAMIQESKYAQCEQTTDNNYDLWSCYDSVWKKDSRNPRKGGSNSSIKWTFFNPTGSGYTYGFGQLGPERALMVTDVVNSVSGFELLTVTNPPAIYDAILNPQISIHYVAATNRTAIDIYKKHANFDISQNPGIVATLYNLGKEYEKAEKLYNRTLKSLTEKGESTYPSVNYYGWLINNKEDTIRATYENAIVKAGCQ